jgi:phospholipase/carboxylesterase
LEKLKLSRPHVWLPQPGASRTLLLLHGSGADEHDLLSLGRELDPRANILSPRGAVSQQGMTRFFEYEPDFTPSRDSLMREVGKLAEFLELASARYDFQLTSVVTVGFSNGSHAGGALLLLRPDLMQTLVAFGTTQVLPDLEQEPDLRGKHVFIANGQQDHYSPEAKTVAMIDQLEGYGAEVTLLMHPGGHQISGDHVRFIASELRG